MMAPNGVAMVSRSGMGAYPLVVWTLGFSSKGCNTDIVYRNLCEAYLVEVGLTQITTNHDTLLIVCHVGIHVDFSSMIISLGP